MGGRGGSSNSDRYNSRGNEYINRLKNRAYAEDVQYRMKRFSDKDIEDAIATINNGLDFNKKQMMTNIEKNVPSAGTLNMKLYERNQQLVKELKEFEYEKKKRVQDKKTIEKMKRGG